MKIVFCRVFFFYLKLEVPLVLLLHYILLTGLVLANTIIHFTNVGVQQVYYLVTIVTRLYSMPFTSTSGANSIWVQFYVSKVKKLS